TTEDELDELLGQGSVLVAEQEAEQARQTARRRLVLLKNTDEVERLTQRLKYLCRLILRRRRPFCSVNGILALFPLPATAADEEPVHTGAVCERALAAVRATTQVHCPVFALVCDLERAPGFAELVRFFPDGPQRHRFIGRHFPLMPQLDLAEMPHMVDSG